MKFNTIDKINATKLNIMEKQGSYKENTRGGMNARGQERLKGEKRGGEGLPGFYTAVRPTAAREATIRGA